MLWLPYQRRWLFDLSATVANVKSRQVGISEVEAFKRSARALGYRWLLRAGPEGKVFPGIPQNFISASERQSIDLLRRAAVHVEALSVAATGESAIKHANAHEILLANGARMRAFAPNPRTIRSVNGDVTLDEFAANPHAEAVWKVVFPMVQANLANPEGGWQLAVISTPEGDTNKFHELMRSPKFAHVSRHEVTIQRAVNEGFPLPKPIAQMKIEFGDDDAWSQEFECSFLASSMRYISAELWDDASVDEDDVPVFPYNVSKFGGYDVGRHHDAAAYGEVAFHEGKLWQNGLVEYEHKMPFDDQEAWISKKLGGGALRVALDAGGMGEVQAERLVNVHRSRIEPVKFTLESKSVLATGLKTVLERGGEGQRMFRPRRDDMQLRREVLLMRRLVSEAGNIRFDVQREKGSHGDGAWAIALAIHTSGMAAKRTEALRPDAVMPAKDGAHREPPRRPMERARRGAWR